MSKRKLITVRVVGGLMRDVSGVLAGHEVCAWRSMTRKIGSIQHGTPPSAVVWAVSRWRGTLLPDSRQWYIFRAVALQPSVRGMLDRSQTIRNWAPAPGTTLSSVPWEYGAHALTRRRGEREGLSFSTFPRPAAARNIASAFSTQRTTPLQIAASISGVLASRGRPSNLRRPKPGPVGPGFFQQA